MFEVLNASRADCDEHIDIDYICGSGWAMSSFGAHGIAQEEWQEISSVGTPSASSGFFGHSSVWSDAVDGFYIFGGHEDHNAFFNVWLYRHQARDFECFRTSHIILIYFNIF